MRLANSPYLLTLMMLLASMTAFADPISDAIKAPDRLPSDRARDMRSDPETTLPLLDLQPGDRVADIWAGGGYYSELIGRIVGDSGEVLLINNAAYAQFAGPALEERQNGRDLGPVTIHTREAENLDLGESSLDAALIIMSYHDLYHVDESGGWPAIDAENFLAQIFTALKPGGRFLIVDHRAAEGTGKASAQDLHRIDVEFAKRDVASAGFRLADSSDALRNPDDDYSLSVFDPAVRGSTDRFILVFEKP